MSERIHVPMSDPALGGWRLELLPKWFEEGPGVEPGDLVDVGWTPPDRPDGYLQAGGFRSLTEARMFLSVLDRHLTGAETTSILDVLTQAGFEDPPPQGLSISGRSNWQKRLDDRWFAYFVHDPAGETTLQVIDGTPIPNRYHDVGRFEIPWELSQIVQRYTAGMEAGLLAILSARIEAGDPSRPLPHGEA